MFYECPRCRNEEHNEGSNYCKICGLLINDGLKESEEGKAIVKYEPRGDCGLEGFGIRDVINYHKLKGKDGKTWFKVQMPSWNDYWETCSKVAFNKCFVVVTEDKLIKLGWDKSSTYISDEMLDKILGGN